MTDTTDNALKPCPFCGGAAIRETTKPYKSITMYETGCSNVGCQCLPSSMKRFTRQKADEAWNTRAALAADPLSDPRVKALVEVLQWYAEQTRLCRLIHSGGDSGRNALSSDGGTKARAALAALEGGKTYG